MATIGGIAVRFHAETRGFISDVNRAAKITGNAGDKMARVMKASAKAMGVAAVAAGGAVTKMASDALRDADRFQKLGIAIGASTEALSQLDFVAQQSGTSFDVVEKSLVRLQKSVMDSNNGLATQTRAFEQLGVSAEALKNLKPEEQFMVIADAARELGVSTERTGALADIFGQRMAKDVIPMLDLGAEGMRELMEEADSLGLTISQDFADNAAFFNDSMNALKQNLVGVGRVMTEALLPTLIHLRESFVTTGGGMDQARAAGEFLGNILKVLATVVATLVTAFKALAHILTAVVVAFMEAGKGIYDAFMAFYAPVVEAINALANKDLKGAAEAIKKFGDGSFTALKKSGANIVKVIKDQIGEAVIDMGEGVDTVTKIWEDQADTLDDKVAPAMRDLAVDSRDLYEEQERLAEETRLAAEEQERLAEAAEETARWLDELEREANPARAATMDYADEVERLTAEFIKPDGLIDSHEEYIALLEALKGRHFPQAAEAATEAADTMSSEMTAAGALIEDTVRNLNSAFSSFFTDLISGSGDAFDNLKETALKALGQIISNYATAQLQIGIGGQAAGGGGGIGGLFGGGGGGLGGLFGGGGGGGLLNGLYSLFGQTRGAGFSFSGLNNSAGGAAIGVLGGSALGGFLDNDRDHYGTSFDYAGTGAMVGAIVGSIIPVIGTMLGGLVGGALGGLFGKFFGRSFEGTLGGSNRRTYSDNAEFETVFGPVLGLDGRGGFGHNGEGFFGDMTSVIQEFDQTLAQFLTADQLAQVTESFKNWSVSVNNTATAADEILNSRFGVVLGAFPAMVQDYVNQFEGLEDRLGAFEVVVQTFNLMSQAIDAFVDSDPAAEIEAALAGPQRLTRELLSQIGADLGTALAEFDGTPEAMAEIAVLMGQRYEAEMQYLRSVAILINDINQSVEAQRAQLEAALAGPEEQLDFGQQVAAINELIASLAAAEGPEEIAAIVAQVQGLVDSAFGNLSQDGISESIRTAGIQTLLELLDALQAAATGRAEEIAGEVIEEGADLRSQAQEFADANGIKLDQTTAAVNDTRNAVDEQTGVIRDEHGSDRQLIGEVVVKLGDVEREIRNLRDGNTRVGFVSG